MFNRAQKEAIEHIDGPMLVLAGPGSGKTMVITYRTKYLIEEAAIDPSKILVITFTKASANEMKERFNKLMECHYTPVTFGTFHAVFFHILKQAYNYSGNNILKEEQRQMYFKEIIEGLQLELEDEKEFIDSVSNEISLVKGEMIDLNHYYSMNCSEEIFKKIYEQYDNCLRRNHLIDFDDMLIYCYELLNARKDILASWQNRYQYILIDEFQDCNTVQYLIVKLLASPRNNLFIVGDDDQSIYRFRGARPEIMLNFHKDYEGCKTVLLNTNYRCAENIVQFASRVIKNNHTRFSKEILSNNPAISNIDVYTFNELKDENLAVIKKIIDYRDKYNIELKDIAIIFRTNTGPRQLVERMMEYNIPFVMRDVLPNIYEHWIAKDIIAYMKMAIGQGNRSDLLRIANKPKRYITRMAIEDNLEQMKAYYKSTKSWMIERIEKLEYDLNIMSKMSPYAALNYIRKGIGYEEYLKEYASYRRMKAEELYDILEELHETTREYKSITDWFLHIEEYAEELKKQNMEKNKFQENAVTMTTMHSSKGLEYRVVFVIDANEKIIPHHKAVLDEDIEEERRLFYVAITRAKQYLHVYSVKIRYEKEMAVSRFVGEMLLNEEELMEDVKVIHQTMGEGSVRKISDGKVMIYFEQIRDTRTLDIKFCMAHQMIRLM